MQIYCLSGDNTYMSQNHAMLFILEVLPARKPYISSGVAAHRYLAAEEKAAADSQGGETDKGHHQAINRSWKKTDRALMFKSNRMAAT